ncbi:MAG: L-aspartate oxidase [Parasphingorhabdus sp.]
MIIITSSSLYEPVVKTQSYKTSTLIIGSGAAGLSLALRLADKGIRSTILSKVELIEGSSYYAQGGIAAVLDANDSFDSHIADTLDAGAGLCSKNAVEHVVSNAPGNIEWLQNLSVNFSRDNKHATGYHLTREGGHSERRVVHSADATGKEVELTLEQLVRKSQHILVLEEFLAIDLITTEKLGLAGSNCCLGVYALDRKSHH